MLAALRRLLTPDPVQLQAAELYVAAVTRSRDPFFYDECGIPDTLDGRFEMILLHLFLLTQRIAITPEEFPDQFTTRLTNVFLADMDRNLREMGVGDTSVGKKIKPMAQAYYGRLKYYRDSWDDVPAFAASLKRNAYGTLEDVAGDQLARLQGYLRDSAVKLQLCPAEELLAGRPQFA